MTINFRNGPVDNITTLVLAPGNKIKIEFADNDGSFVIGFTETDITIESEMPGNMVGGEGIIYREHFGDTDDQVEIAVPPHVEDGTTDLYEYWFRGLIQPQAKSKSPNPIFEKNQSWWHWDESWTDAHGPFSSEQDARRALRSYANHLEGKPAADLHVCINWHPDTGNCVICGANHGIKF